MCLYAPTVADLSCLNGDSLPIEALVGSVEERASIRRRFRGG